jgi:hypothetical protein
MVPAQAGVISKPQKTRNATALRVFFCPNGCFAGSKTSLFLLR